MATNLCSEEYRQEHTGHLVHKGLQGPDGFGVVEGWKRRQGPVDRVVAAATRSRVGTRHDPRVPGWVSGEDEEVVHGRRGRVPRHAPLSGRQEGRPLGSRDDSTGDHPDNPPQNGPLSVSGVVTGTPAGQCMTRKGTKNEFINIFYLNQD